MSPSPTRTRLPEYEEVASYLRTYFAMADIEARTGAPPTGRPTRKGIGRYAAACIATAYEDHPEWYRLWMSASDAYWFCKDWLKIRLPRDTFRVQKARVAWLVVGLPKAKDTPPRRAYDWARST